MKILNSNLRDFISQKNNALIILLMLLSFSFTSNAQCPEVNQPANRAVCNNSINGPVIFTGSMPGAVYNWTNNNPSIGLAASGSGNMAGFTAVNNSTTPVTATITVTPVVTGGGFAYISNQNDNTVSVINTATNALVSTMPAGDYPIGVSISSDGSRAYVSNFISSNVLVYNTAGNSLVADITVGFGPAGLVVNPAGTRVYVANLASGNISVINTTNNTVEATINIDLQTRPGTPYGITVSPDGSRVYVVKSSGEVAIINTADNSITGYIPVGSNPYGIAINAAGTRLYVANGSSNTVSVINTITNIVESVIAVGINPKCVTVSPDGSSLCVTNYGENTISIINTASNTVTNTIYVGVSPFGISMNGNGSAVYVANSNSNSISVIDMANYSITDIGVGSGPAAFGNFVSGSGSGCTGESKTFTITVNPTPICSITSVPADNTYTGGVPTNIYLGYGPQSTRLQVNTPSGGAPYTYKWTGANASRLSSTTSGSPVFAPTTGGSYPFMVEITSSTGCKSTCTITICVLDIREYKKGSPTGKVFVCHAAGGNAHTLSISTNAVPAHLGNHAGDRLGACEDQICVSNLYVTNKEEQHSIDLTKTESGEFAVQVYPNPSAGDFVIRLLSGSQTAVKVIITDGSGAIQNINTVNTKGLVTIPGKTLQAGTYYAEVIQGNNRRVVRLVKIN